MRWTDKKNPSNGETRDVVRFLWLPLKIGKETRWLERATIKQEFIRVRYGNSTHIEEEWDDKEFLTPPKDKQLSTKRDAETFLVFICGLSCGALLPQCIPWIVRHLAYLGVQL